MRKQTISLTILLLTLVLFFPACADKVSKDADHIQWDSLSVVKSAHLLGDTAAPSCQLDLNIWYAATADSTGLRDSVNAYITAFSLGSYYVHLTPQEAVASYVQKYVEEYRNDLEPIYQTESEMYDDLDSSAWDFTQTLHGHVQFYHQNLLVYRKYYEEYTGGVHGMYLTSFLNLDLHTMLPIRLDDILVDNYQEQLTDLLCRQLMKDEEVGSIAELEEIGYMSNSNLEPTENFYLDEKGITFYYNVYEIAPFVMGPTAITLSYDTLHHLLSDDSQVINEIRIH
ncbi:MAG: DUF3298 domain-containing protein [Bacteroides sp.]|nr:DUF3298 domain-containing protein [Bacteroides sp.]